MDILNYLPKADLFSNSCINVIYQPINSTLINSNNKYKETNLSIAIDKTLEKKTQYQTIIR